MKKILWAKDVPKRLNKKAPKKTSKKKNKVKKYTDSLLKKNSVKRYEFLFLEKRVIEIFKDLLSKRRTRNRVNEHLPKNSPSKKSKNLMLFLIRLAEVLTASIIPSTIGLLIVLITPKTRVMQVMECISFMAFFAVSCIFWIKYVKYRQNRVEFYVMHSAVYALYAGLSVIAYSLSDVYLYSIFFSDLRGFEIFGYRTIQSMAITHLIMVIGMIICETAAHLYYKDKAKKATENGIEKPEMKSIAVTPKQDNQEVKFLSIDEVNDEIDREMQEAADMIRSEYENASDKNWSDDMVQGENGAIIETVPVDPENDIDDADFVSEAYAREEMKVTENYSDESLWNDDIYKGENQIYDYGEEEYATEEFSKADENAMWDEEMYKGNGETVEFNEDDESDDMTFFEIYNNELNQYTENDLDSYDPDNLWGEIKQGR